MDTKSLAKFREKFRALSRASRSAMIQPLTTVLLLSWIAAQPIQDGPLIRISSRLVLVDVVVTDGQGDFLDGLRKEDFSLFEDGRPQEVEFFIPPPDSLSGDGAPDTPEGLSAATPRQRNTIVILVDSVTVDSSTLMRVRDALRSFFNRHHPRDEIMLVQVDPGLRLLQPPTSDWETVLQAVEEIPLHRSTSFETVSISDLLASLEDNYRNVPRDRESVLGMALEQSVGQANDYLALLEARVRASSRAISVISDSLKHQPGRKSVIYLSGGFPMKPIPLLRQALTDLTMAHLGYAAEYDSEVRGSISRTLSKMQDHNFYRYLNRAVHEANQAGVSLHTLDARGLVAIPAVGSAQHKGSMNLEIRGRDTLDAQMADVTDAQNYLVSLSLNTGGLFFTNNNDLAAGLSRAYRDMSRYYLLAYRPASFKKKGAFHEIEVKVARKGAQVRARRGYLEESAKESLQATLFNAVSHPELYRSFPVSLQLDPAGKRKMRISVSVPGRKLSFQPKNDQWVDQLEIYAVLIDENGKWASKKFQVMKNYTIELNAETYRSILEQDLVSQAEIQAQPGRYDLVVVVKETPTGAIATAETAVEF